MQPDTGERTKSMKAIKKTENVVGEKKEKEEVKQELIVIDPDNELLAFSVADFLAERTAERLDRAFDEMELETVAQIVRRLECCSHEEAAKMLQMIFLANESIAEAEDLDLLWICVEHDERTFDYFIHSLSHTDIFEKLDIAATVLLDDASEQVFLPFHIS